MVGVVALVAICATSIPVPSPGAVDVSALLGEADALYARRGEGAFGPVELTSDTGGLRIATPASTTTVAWPQLTALRLDDRTLLFERHRLLVVWVPRTAFASDRERDEFVRYAQYQMTRPSA